MATEHRLIEPFLPEGAGLRERIEGGGPYELYVKQPIEEGLGAGLTRRHDAAFAWVKRQMASGEVEPMDVQAARTNLFRRTWMERGERMEDCDDVVRHPGLASAAKDLFGHDVVEPYMLYANLLLPGQELPVHHDTPEFAGLDKTVCPEWFLVVCGQSGLFEDRRIHVASAVVFVAGEGDSIIYPDGVESAPAFVPPSANTAVVLDADELVHGVRRVGGPRTDAPPVEIGRKLVFNGEGWDLRGDEVVAQYGPEQIRLSLQWKARTFPDAAARRAVLERPLTMAEATTTLVEELRRRGHSVDPDADDMELALSMMEEFIALPTS